MLPQRYKGCYPLARNIGPNSFEKERCQGLIYPICSGRNQLMKSPGNAALSKDDFNSYRPLRNHLEIRTLEQLPGEDDMPLEGVIHHVSVDPLGEYWAMSYF
jgi:hypothetical protein